MVSAWVRHVTSRASRPCRRMSRQTNDKKRLRQAGTHHVQEVCDRIRGTRRHGHLGGSNQPRRRTERQATGLADARGTGRLSDFLHSQQGGVPGRRCLQDRIYRRDGKPAAPGQRRRQRLHPLSRRPRGEMEPRRSLGGLRGFRADETQPPHQGRHPGGRPSARDRADQPRRTSRGPDRQDGQGGLRAGQYPQVHRLAGAIRIPLPQGRDE